MTAVGPDSGSPPPAGSGAYFLAALIASSDDAIVSKTLDGTILSWNPAAERIFGYSASEMIGASVFKLIPDDLHDEEHGILARIRAGQHVAHYETTRMRKDGERILVSLTLSPVRDMTGELIGASAIKRDITQQRAVEDQLRQAQKMEALGQLAGGVAHDFNNILTIIAGFSGFLSRSLDPLSPAQEDVLGIQQATERAGRLTQQLLAFTRHQRVHTGPVDLAAIVSETAVLLRRLLGEHIRLEVKPAIAEVWVMGDRGQLSQVLINLAVNARDAMPEGGTLSISAFEDAPAGRAVLTVRDTGHGMDARTRGRLFEPFFTTKPQGRGTGLGLSTVFSIVERSSGTIEVDTAPGRGTVFRITLPQAPAPTLPDAIDPGRDLRGTEMLLVVDDNADLAELAARTLREYGYAVEMAAGAGAAMVVFAESERPVDLIVTDIVMPGMSGPALVERLRLRDPHPAVLYMTGYDETLVAAHLTDASAPTLSKPFTPLELATAVRQVLDRRASAPGKYAGQIRRPAG